MNWFCVLKWSLIFIAWGSSLLTAIVVAYGLGWRRANKSYWKMMHRAGSKITRGDF